MFGEFGRIRHLTGMLGEGHALMARNYMNVKVEDGLSRRGLVELHDQHTTCVERLLYRAGDLLDGSHDGTNVGRSGIEKIARGIFRHDKRMALRLGHDVHEGKSIAILTDLVA